MTDSLPKVMLPVGGRPLIEYHLESLREHGIGEVLINLHHLPEVIRDHLGNGRKFGLKIRYFPEKQLRGTAGALIPMGNHLEQTFLLIYGDLVSKLNYTKLINFHHRKGSHMTLVTHHSDHPQDSDCLALDQQRRVRDFFPKPHQGNPSSNLTSAAIYVMEKEIIKYIPKDEIPIDFGHNILPALAKKKLPLFGYLTKEYVKDVGTWERYHKVKQDWLGWK